MRRVQKSIVPVCLIRMIWVVMVDRIIVLVGMSMAEAKLKRHKHIYDRLLGVLKFETFNKNDVAKIVTEISEVEFEPDALELVCTKFNQFRQIVKFINKVENVAVMNNLKTITLSILEGILNER